MLYVIAEQSSGWSLGQVVVGAGIGLVASLVTQAFSGKLATHRDRKKERREALATYGVCAFRFINAAESLRSAELDHPALKVKWILRARTQDFATKLKSKSPSEVLGERRARFEETKLELDRAEWLLEMSYGSQDERERVRNCMKWVIDFETADWEMMDKEDDEKYTDPMLYPYHVCKDRARIFVNAEVDKYHRESAFDSPGFR